MTRSPASQARHDATLAIVKQANLDFVTTVLQLLKEEGLKVVPTNKDGKEILVGEYHVEHAAHGTVTVDKQEVTVGIEAEASYERDSWGFHRNLNGKSNVAVSVGYDKVYRSTSKDTVKAATKAAAELAAAIRGQAARKNREAAAAKARAGIAPAVLELRNEFELTYDFSHCSVKGKKAEAKINATPNGVALDLRHLTVEQARKVLAILAE